jgi:hypothetical protein
VTIFDRSKIVGKVGWISYPPTGHEVTYVPAAGYANQRRAASEAAIRRLKAMVEATPEQEKPK